VGGVRGRVRVQKPNILHGMRTIFAQQIPCLPSRTFIEHSRCTCGRSTPYITPNLLRSSAFDRKESATHIPAAFNFLRSLVTRKKSTPPILQDGENPVLRTEAADVPESMFGGEELRLLANEMVRTMRAAPGVGLAGPQIGKGLKILVCEERPEYIAMQSKKTLEALQRRPFEVMVICNPRLTPVGRKGYRYWEGCLSVAGYQGLVDRYTSVGVSGLDIDGKPVRFQAEGWQARILQHEVDHLHGVLYVDRALPDSVSPYEAPPTDLRAELGPCECSHPLK